MTQEQNAIKNCFLNFNNGRGGKYIEVGCDDNQQESNAAMLLQNGWYGTLVDCSPTCMGKLRKFYGTDPRVQLLQYALTDFDGSFKYTDKVKTENGQYIYNNIEVNSMSMRRFLSLYGNDIDFLVLNADALGMNYVLLSLINNDFYHKLKCICIRHDGYAEKVKERLSPFGFKTIFMNENSLIMSKV